MRCKLETIVFLSGFNVMALELVGSRILAPFLGTSVFVWTSLIGVILGSLSLGYWRGGIAADKDPSYKKLSSVLYYAGILIGVTAVANIFILHIVTSSGFGTRIGSVLAAALLFAPAAMFFGMVSPLAAKIKLNNLKDLGKNVGGLYALSTIGSILGTFVSGFYLISYFGSELTLAFISLLTISTAFIANPDFKTILKKSAIPVFIFLSTLWIVRIKADSPAFRDIDTDYKRVWIVDQKDPKTGRPMRYMMDSQNTAQSEMFLDSDNELAAPYTKYYDFYKFFSEKSDHVLMLGGGAFSYPKHFITTNKTGQIDVVEIDPAMTWLAEKYFKLKPDSRMTIINEDARVFLNTSEKKYDAMFVDVFNATFAIPYHMITKEAIEKEYERLNDGGAVIVNIIATIEGSGREYFRAALATYKSVFPQVYAFPVQLPENGYAVQNIMLVALKSPVPHALSSNDTEMQSYLSHLWIKNIPQDAGVFTDNFAPVERYAEEML